MLIESKDKSREAPRPTHEPPVRGILIVRLSAIGDVIMSTVILPGLKARYPQAHIRWLTTPLGEEILRGHPLVDEIIVLPTDHRRIRKIGMLVSFASRLRQRRFDLVLDLQGLWKSAIWARCARSCRRISRGGFEGSGIILDETVAVDRSEVGGLPGREYFGIARFLGLPESALAMFVCPSEDDPVPLSKEACSPVVLVPFTTRPQKHWPEENWVALADRLGAEWSHPVWVLGGPSNLRGARDLARASTTEVRVLAGARSGLREKMAVLARSALTIGVDTGLTHMSLALRRPTLALFGSTCPYDATGSVPGAVLHAGLSCSPCHRHPTCGGRFDCMRLLTVDSVLREVRRVLRPVPLAEDPGSGFSLPI